MEYATGSDPTQASGPVSQFGQSSDGTRLTLSFNRIADPALTYSVMATNDLTAGTWSPGLVEHRYGKYHRVSHGYRHRRYQWESKPLSAFAGVALNEFMVFRHRFFLTVGCLPSFLTPLAAGGSGSPRCVPG